MILIIPIIVGFIYLNNFINNTLDIKNIDSEVKVTKVISNGIVVEKNFLKFYIKTNEYFEEQQVIYLKSSKLEKIKSKDTFDNYLLSINVKYKVYNFKIKKINNEPTIKQKIINYFTRGPAYSSKYIPLALFGIKTFDSEIIYNKLKDISIIHLFVVSGFHLNFLIIIILKMLRIFKINNKYLVSIFPILILLPYLWIMNFPLSSVRAFIYIFISLLNKNFLKNKIHKLNILGLSMIIIFCINPYVIYSLSFLFSFIVSYSIVFVLGFENKIKCSKIIISFIAWLSTIGINIYINKEINILSLVNSLFFTPIITFSYFITLLFFWLKPLMDNWYFLLDVLINIFVYFSFKIKIFISFEWVLIYYLIFYIILIIKMEKPNFNDAVSKILLKWINQY